MSLILNDSSILSSNPHENDVDARDLELLDRYLAIVETNRKSSQFVPNDAMLALDMAGFIMGRLGGRPTGRISTARMALSLAQPTARAPVQ